jgi:hypothetical protein
MAQSGCVSNDGDGPARVAAGRSRSKAPARGGVIWVSRTLQSTPESGTRASFALAKCRRGSKVPSDVDTLEHLSAVLVTPANAQDRHQVDALAKQVQDVTGDAVDLAFVDQAYTGEQAAQDAVANHMELEVVKFPNAQRGFVLLPRR